jgi:hypothetical protein
MSPNHNPESQCYAKNPNGNRARSFAREHQAVALNSSTRKPTVTGSPLTVREKIIEKRQAPRAPWREALKKRAPWRRVSCLSSSSCTSAEFAVITSSRNAPIVTARMMRRRGGGRRKSSAEAGRAGPRRGPSVSAPLPAPACCYGGSARVSPERLERSQHNRSTANLLPGRIAAQADRPAPV